VEGSRVERAAPPRRGWFRVLIVAGATVYLVLLSRAALTAWILENPSAGRLQSARRWNASDAATWSAYARSQWRPVDPGSSPEVIAAYRQALARNPFNVNDWNDLASEYLRLSESAKAEAALRAALAAVPQSPRAAWRLANFLLQQGRQEESYPFFRTAASADVSLLDSLLELSWKLLDDPLRIYDDLVPRDSASRVTYLYFLILKKQQLRAAYPVWERIVPIRNEAAVHVGETYVAALAAAGMGDLAEQGWRDLNAGLDPPSPADERIVNGDFERPLRNAGLDWRIETGPGYRVSLDNFEANSGSRSLRVDFDGTTNPEFAAVYQWVPVEPNTEYALMADMKTANLSTSSGAFLWLGTRAAPAGESWEQSTPELVGSTPWTRETLTVQTGPGTRVLSIQLCRHQSTKLNNLLQGTVWLDGVSLRPRAR
jgi:hypothetical protein